jgi:hypothetical protein
MLDPELLERITARRADLDELAVAERVLERMSEQLADERASAAPAPGAGGRTRGKLVRLVDRG